MRSPIPFALIRQILSTNAPPHLFHYTSPAGLIGILSNRSLWATDVQHMNDLKELRQAIETAQIYINNKINALYRGQVNSSFREANKSDRHAAILQLMSGHVGSHGAGIFVVSLTEQRDLLSQWRAYCPPGGGYAFGLPTSKLLGLAERQDFYLTPCVYDEQKQYKIMAEMVEFHFSKIVGFMEADKSLSYDDIRMSSALASFSEDVARYGAILKHRSFVEEREWRLISAPIFLGDPRLKFRIGRRSVVPYCEFALFDSSCPNIAEPSGGDHSVVTVVGPTSSPGPAQLAVQSLMYSHLGAGCAHGMSEVPYRGNEI
jgi:hypothetical protein